MISKDYEYIYGMATITYDTQIIDAQGTFGPGSSDLYATGAKGYATISQIRFYCASAYDLTLEIVRANPVSTVTVYSFTLSAGDVVLDTNGYHLGNGDKITATSTGASTMYTLVGKVGPFTP